MIGQKTNGPLLNIPRPETPSPVFEKPSPEYNSVFSSRQDFKSVTLSPSLVGYPVSNGSTPLPTKPALHNPNRGVDFGMFFLLLYDSVSSSIIERYILWGLSSHSRMFHSYGDVCIFFYRFNSRINLSYQCIY